MPAKAIWEGATSMATKADFQGMADWCSQGIIVDPYGNKGLCVVLAYVEAGTPQDLRYWRGQGALQFIQRTTGYPTDFYDGVLSGIGCSATLTLVFGATVRTAWAGVNGSDSIAIDEILPIRPNNWRISFSKYTCYCSLGLVSPDFVQPQPVVIEEKPQTPQPPTGLTVTET
jgi:hypothetical protein